MERLSSVAQQLGCRAEPAATTTKEPATAGALRLLTREQLATFVVDGVLVLQVDDLPPNFHAELYQRCQESVGGKSADEDTAGLIEACVRSLEAVKDEVFE